MHLYGSLLDRPHLNVITRHADHELTRIQNVIEGSALVDGRADLEELFSALLACEGARTPKTLDLIGHSTHDCLMQIGDWVIDATRPRVTAYFRNLADNDVLPRLGVNAMRLLGCHTASTKQGRATIRALSDILGIEVYGATNALIAAHYDASGFVREREYMLGCASDFRREPVARPIVDVADRQPYARFLDIDALPVSPITGEVAWPRRLATADDVRSILQYIRRDQGACMPGMLVVPSCEIVIPSARAGMYHRAQLVLDGAFLRVYPDGDELPGIVFPIDDPRAINRIVGSLQLLTQRMPTLK